MKETIKVIADSIDRIEKELGYDWRFSHVHLNAGDDTRVEVGLSRREVLDGLAGALSGYGAVSGDRDHLVLSSPDGVTVEVALLGGGAKTVAWITASVADVRRGPDHASELLTQAIMGDTAVPLRREGDWLLVRLPDEYHGWIRSWYVTDTDPREVAGFDERAERRVAGKIEYVLSSPEEGAVPIPGTSPGPRRQRPKKKKGKA